MFGRRRLWACIKCWSSNAWGEGALGEAGVEFEGIANNEYSALTLYHGTDLGSASDILENGFDMSKAAELGGGDALWTSTSSSDAGWFAEANPSGGAPATVQITVPQSAIDNLSSQGLLSIEGPVYRFEPAAVNVLNSSSTMSLVPKP
jgi:hypothetical protein